ncbi:putative LRR receptor-like serine/threonine-protein kinase [Tripterygium wilfordii]|uniref:non-specific serine/threonine protein kinase n=1 Tax=Tripterygium wilfordii TaxID=458696 RepID=A0A7J7D2R3_TRIWF|nr:putative LRR receptor-like serine/threonine-protein kinase [Tripterygium wilfordii]
MSYNSFVGALPHNISNLAELTVLDLTANKLSGRLPTDLSQLTKLQVINLGQNSLSGPIPPSIANVSSLIRLNLGTNLLSESVGNLSKSLSIFYMGDNRIYGRIPASIGQLTGIALFNVSYNSMNGSIPPEIGQLKELQELGLAGNQLSGTIPDSLGSLGKVNQIDLSGNQLVGQIPTSFGNFGNLISMDLSNNRLNGSIPREVLSLSSLSKILNLSRNLLSGPLNEQVGVLDNIVTIDLSNNRLSGNIPSSIKTCRSLERLFLAKNELSGRIPNSLGEVKGLEVLDLSYNQLSGSIPTDLQDLQALQSVNLSFNNLEGVIPSGGVFRNLSKVKLEGNPKLCSYSGCDSSPRHRNLVLIVCITVSIIAFALCIIVGSFVFVRKHKRNSCGTSDLLKAEHQTVSYHELRRATDNFNQANLVGKGSFGSVYKGYLGEVLNYLHDDIEVPVVHCDLKPSNILLDEDMTAKVGDFGLAKLLVNRTNNQHSISSTFALKGSIGYIPPEYGIGQKPSKAGDVYSFGVMLLELFTGKSPVDDCFMGELNLIESVRSVFPHKILQALDPEILQHMEDPDIQHECMNKIFGVGLSCTADSPDSRISMKDALRELKSVKRILLSD